MTDNELHDAILSDPEAKALADAGDDVGAATRLISTLSPVPSPLPNSKLLVWAASRGVLKGIIAGTVSANALIASACLAVQASLNGGAMSLDLTNPIIMGTGGLIDGLTAAGILPPSGAGSKADLIAYGSIPVDISHGDVSRVWEQYRPGGIVGGEL